MLLLNKILFSFSIKENFKPEIESFSSSKMSKILFSFSVKEHLKLDIKYFFLLQDVKDPYYGVYLYIAIKLYTH